MHEWAMLVVFLNESKELRPLYLKCKVAKLNHRKPYKAYIETKGELNDRNMASDKAFVDFVLDQIENAGTITAKKMFGEYGLYSDAKIFALVCDNKLFIKPTSGGRAFIKDVVEAPPYPGAKPSFLIEDKLEDPDWMSQLVAITVAELPEPKPKNKKPKKT